MTTQVCYENIFKIFDYFLYGNWIEYIKWRWLVKPVSKLEVFLKQSLQFVKIKSIYELFPSKKVCVLIRFIKLCDSTNDKSSVFTGSMLKSFNRGVAKEIGLGVARRGRVKMWTYFSYVQIYLYCTFKNIEGIVKLKLELVKNIM